MPNENKISYSELFSELVNDEGQLDDAKASFLYYMFPQEMFIRALSLLESGEIFIYIYPCSTSTDLESLVNTIVQTVYNDHNDGKLIKVVVQTNDDRTIFTDIEHWFCSCQEYSEKFSQIITSDPETPLQVLLLKEIDNVEDFSSDKFAQLEANSLSKQRYFNHSKVICPHLLACSILLKSSSRILHFFTVTKGSVLVFPINDIDEWLRLHVNIA
ncbi:hypothetical protein TBLA_0B01910 [Henningerozyma blattae CBS 6284]|uniref:Suppressor of hydroxyurea sensitivity protein 2 n=1 Tax=Henningerozyma blattae (strain ATCC 34711 / CBS 6284 / DSM 70876 / NBRC 10599 / NRRL Y-10934 / UCD 77-7) TaxID=1071380 RepID=I2GY33_HENB6|nr:hypothetical protein TBLA_0B01910 [Tetrapisispora blattae CBS 6284]CCH59035.1 hypothetical protein TBLA_0B01910 [Tetrapisispora blattae CBS 6284]